MDNSNDNFCDSSPSPTVEEDALSVSQLINHPNPPPPVQFKRSVFNELAENLRVKEMEIREKFKLIDQLTQEIDEGDAGDHQAKRVMRVQLQEEVAESFKQFDQIAQTLKEAYMVNIAI
ncbi:hypothetical protein GCK72_013021 [Caenorhabditis remanei]|uniref:Uncharacterized protein n=1 Tax=Caenorhabditis remanei TaxID=31234 RepID=A0A6A5GMI3_CAERE|nr:hypothetical protein GCK72_013021 [Caenorhabditis remanei]KAF1756568.1 hypothetical protein GCK72_013021 [Caenorhabditis remanei]